MTAKPVTRRRSSRCVRGRARGTSPGSRARRSRLDGTTDGGLALYQSSRGSRSPDKRPFLGAMSAIFRRPTGPGRGRWETSSARDPWRPYGSAKNSLPPTMTLESCTRFSTRRCCRRLPSPEVAGDWVVVQRPCDRSSETCCRRHPQQEGQGDVWRRALDAPQSGGGAVGFDSGRHPERSEPGTSHRSRWAAKCLA